MTRIQISQIFLVTFFVFFVGHVRASLEGEGIIGGDDAEDGEYGYQVSLQQFGENLCGSAIIANYYIITAAHCLVDSKNKFFRTTDLKVLAGTSYLHSSSPYKIVVNIDEAFIPVEYDRRIDARRGTGDIAVLKLKQSPNIYGNPNLRKLELPDENLKVDWAPATVTGFGSNEVYTRIDPITGKKVGIGDRNYGNMRYAKSHVISNVDCTTHLGKLSSKHLCAVVTQRNVGKPEGVCNGDSGSPLAHDNTLIGIVIASPRGCREDFVPALYTRASSFVRFIKQVMTGNIDGGVRRFKFSM